MGQNHVFSRFCLHVCINKLYICEVNYFENLLFGFYCWKTLFLQIWLLLDILFILHNVRNVVFYLVYINIFVKFTTTYTSQMWQQYKYIFLFYLWYTFCVLWGSFLSFSILLTIFQHDPFSKHPFYSQIGTNTGTLFPDWYQHWDSIPRLVPTLRQYSQIGTTLQILPNIA